MLPILLYGSETWTLTARLRDLLDGTHTRLLRKCLDVHYRQHMTNEALYGSLMSPSALVAERRLRLAGHCIRADQPVADVLLWTAPGPQKVGRPPVLFPDLLCRAAQVVDRSELERLMSNRWQWKRVISNFSGLS